MTKIITAPQKLTPEQKLVRAYEKRITAVFALDDTLTYRQRTSVIRDLIKRACVEFYYTRKEQVASTEATYCEDNNKNAAS